MSADPVYLCAVGHPWLQKPNGDWVRESHEDAAKRIAAGAMKRRKPYDAKNGF